LVILVKFIKADQGFY